MPQAASADCIACESDAPVLAIGDHVFVRAEVRRLDHDGRVVMLSIPAVLGTGINYIVAPPGCIEQRETRRGVRLIPVTGEKDTSWRALGLDRAVIVDGR